MVNLAEEVQDFSTTKEHLINQFIWKILQIWRYIVFTGRQPNNISYVMCKVNNQESERKSGWCIYELVNKKERKHFCWQILIILLTFSKLYRLQTPHFTLLETHRHMKPVKKGQWIDIALIWVTSHKRLGTAATETMTKNPEWVGTNT